MDYNVLSPINTESVNGSGIINALMLNTIYRGTS